MSNTLETKLSDSTRTNNIEDDEEDRLLTDTTNPIKSTIT